MRGPLGAHRPPYLGGISMNADQQRLVEFYLGRLRDGHTHDITQSRHHHDALCKLMTELRPQTTQMENDEAVIRANLRIWSTLSP
jgi:hypothetical protein